MATNYTLAEARKAILENNKEAIADFGKRFPLATVILSKIEKNEAVEELLNALPEHITMRKIESVLKDGIAETEDNDEVNEPVEELVEDLPVAEEVEEKPAKKEKKEKKEKAPKKEKAAKVEEVMPEPVEEEINEESKYAGKTAVELFKICKSKGIKVEPKQKADVYVKLLEAADQSNAESEDEDDDWDI